MTTIQAATGRLTGVSEEGPALLPLEAGQHYRFRFDMNACIGCHSCEVACAEANGLPVDVAWRKVGEFEGGTYPSTRRFHLSLACNHCIDPGCMSGCPTSAYTKAANGIVLHDAESCIGCRYCMWSCPYSVPVFDKSRRVVSKCDMCAPRLEAGLTSACVDACPTNAIGIEAVDVHAWRADHRQGDAPHLPSADLTLSTTRIILPANVPAGTVAASEHRVELEAAHAPLIAVTLLTQASVGSLAASVATGSAGTVSALVAASSGVAALVASLFHLGRPAYAYKALRNLRSSWLSREVAAFGIYAALAIAYALAAGVGPTAAPAIGGVAVAAGLSGVFASARLYMVPGRPSWASPATIAQFGLAAVVLGLPIAAFTTGDPTGPLLAFAGAAAVAQVAVQLAHLRRLARDPRREAQATAALAFRTCRLVMSARLASTGAALVILYISMSQGSRAGILAFAVCAAAGEVVGRYLFYVTVVPLAPPRAFFGRL